MSGLEWAIAAAVGLAVLLIIGIWLHHIFEGEWLPSDLWREWKLSRTSLAALDAAWAANPGRSSITVTLTTIPSRLGAIDDTLKSLLDQARKPQRILLNIPEWSEREGCAYQVPERLRGLASVEIRPCRDWGPATKLIPSVLSEPADAALLVVDDDRIYPPWTVARFEEESAETPDDALALGGWVVPADLTDRPTTVLSNLLMRPPVPVRAPRLSRRMRVDVLLGVMGYLVRPRFFDLDEIADFSAGPSVLRLVDDVRTSALCRAAKYVIPGPSLSFIPKRRRGLYQKTALGRINRGRGGNDQRHNTIAIRYFADRWGTAKGGR